MYKVKPNAPKNGVFISDSFGPESHFEVETDNVLKLYKDITGENVDLVNLP